MRLQPANVCRQHIQRRVELAEVAKARAVSNCRQLSIKLTLVLEPMPYFVREIVRLLGRARAGPLRACERQLLVLCSASASQLCNHTCAFGTHLSLKLGRNADCSLYNLFCDAANSSYMRPIALLCCAAIAG